MVIRPPETVGPIAVRAVGAHHLNVLRADSIPKTAVVQPRVANLSANVAHRLRRGTRLRKTNLRKQRPQNRKSKSLHKTFFTFIPWCKDSILGRITNRSLKHSPFSAQELGVLHLFFHFWCWRRVRRGYFYVFIREFGIRDAYLIAPKGRQRTDRGKR